MGRLDAEIDFRQIRAYGSPAARSAGFEELASLIVKDGIPGLIDWPDGVTFQRFGNPDGGREGSGILPGGDVWAWQAKYLFALGDSELAQVDGSVRRALATEPRLTRYFVVLPYDRPAGDTRRRGRPVKSAYTKWLEKKAVWEADRNVEIVYVGASELLTELTRVANAGRIRYWFGASVLALNEQRDRLADVVNKVGRRYTPQLHVEVEAVRALDALGRSESYVRRIQVVLAALRRTRGAPRDDCRRQLIAAEVALDGFLAAARGVGRLPRISDELEGAEAALEVALPTSVSLVRSDAIRSALTLVRSTDTAAADRGLLLMTGRAGVGKTHLFCDVAVRRIEAGRPTIVLLGQDFDDTTLLPQVGRLAGIGGSLDDVLGVLDAAGEAAGYPAMLLIDAINESARADRWADELRVLAGAVDRHPNVVLAVSCRTEFVAAVVGETELPQVEHVGFAESTAEAVDRYTTEYGLQRVTLPVLDPEFGNPLFLKLACEGLSTLGPDRYSLGKAGLTTVCDAFLEAVNERLARPGRCDYDKASRLVQSVVRRLAQLGPGPYERADVVEITSTALPNRPWSQSLFVGLLREGVLLETHADKVVFSYQRLGDVQRAMLLAESTDLAGWYRALDSTTSWRENGVLGALGVILPETRGIEIVDLFGDGSVDRQIVDAFLESLTLRSAEHTTARTASLVEELLGSADVWLALVRVACVPGHAVNAEFLHRVLSDLALPDRDRSWSEWLVDDGSDQVVRVLLDWAWPDVRESEHRPDDVAGLAALVIGWLLTSTVRGLRDRATKALVSLGERNPRAVADAVRRFRGCNDPYVVERLAGAVCAIALRAESAEVITTVADSAAELVADGVPVHLMTRDYLWRTAGAARLRGWSGPDWQPPYGAVWPVDELGEPPGDPYSSVGDSLESGDFGRHILEPALDEFAVDDPASLVGEAERFILARVLQLGWTPELFAELDGHRRGGVERYGKKYQWIGLYDVLARLADNLRLQVRWDNQAVPFHSAVEVIGRDIDPTVLVREGRDALDQPTWFAPVAAVMDGLPDPLELISLTGPDGDRWLSLVRYDNWTQELPPEVAASGVPAVNVTMQLRSYLVAVGDIPAVRAWAEGQDYDGGRMPEHTTIVNRLLATHPASPDWDLASGQSNEPYELPFTVELPYSHYTGTGTTRDNTDNVSGYVPTQLLFNVLNLNRGQDFTWTDPSGPAVLDPTAGITTVGALVMRRELAQTLSDAGYALLWTAQVTRRNLTDDFEADNASLTTSASYLLVDDTLEALS
ncbi:hypothetical protein [Kribbella sp. NPDC055071]